LTSRLLPDKILSRSKDSRWLAPVSGAPERLRAARAVNPAEDGLVLLRLLPLSLRRGFFFLNAIFNNGGEKFYAK